MVATYRCCRSGKDMPMSNEELVEQIQEGIDVSGNINTLYLNNKNFIAAIAKRYTGLAELDDLMQEGYIGLHNAIYKYEPGQGILFLSYAGHWVKQQIIRYMEESDLIRRPSHQYQRIQRLNKLQNAFMNTYGRTPTDYEIEVYLKLSTAQVRKLKQDSHSYRLASLDSPVKGDDGENLLIGDCVAAAETTEQSVIEPMEIKELKRDLWSAVDTLEEEQSNVLHNRFEGNMTLDQIGQIMGVTKNQVRAHELQALRRLRAKKEIKQIGRDYGFINSTAYKYSLERFKTTWTSSTEFVALKNLESMERD